MPLARVDRLELLDRLDGTVQPTELAGNLRDIRRANRLFGGSRSMLRACAPFIRELAGTHGRAITVLDVATGSADIPLAIVNLAQRNGWRVQVVASDLQPDVLAVARASERSGMITVEQADALDLPYPDNTFDLVTLALAMHHFEPHNAVRVLREMRRVARCAMIVGDLERSRLGLLGAWLFGHALTRNRLTRHDAPLSVRRAYTRDEAAELACTAGWESVGVRSAFAFRYVLTGRP